MLATIRPSIEVVQALAAELERLAWRWRVGASGEAQLGEELGLGLPLPWFELGTLEGRAEVEARVPTKWLSAVLEDGRPVGTMVVSRGANGRHRFERFAFGSSGAALLEALEWLEAGWQAARPEGSDWVVAGFDDRRSRSSGLLLLPQPGDVDVTVALSFDAPPPFRSARFIPLQEYQERVDAWLARPG